MTKVTPPHVLVQTIRLALRIEEHAKSTAIDTPLKLIAIGFLIRNRRLAEAILRLNTEYAYEGRMLLRTMVEILINHSWIRLKFSKSRALRFAAYHPLELLRISQHTNAIAGKKEDLTMLRNLKRERSSVRHLFQARDKKGKLRWAGSWARTESIEARLREVLTYRKKRPPDMFMYTLYSWTSSAVHGGPNSLREIIEWNGPYVSAKGQPEASQYGQYAGAAAILNHSIQAACDALDLKGVKPEELDALTHALKYLRENDE